MTTLIMSPLVLAGISLYRRHLSPLKGFRCAYGAERPVKTCSAFGRYVFERYDVTTATTLLRRRFAACRSAYERMKVRKQDRRDRKSARSTKRDCDLPDIGGCDGSPDLPCDCSF